VVGVVRVAERDRKGMRLYLHGRNGDKWMSRWQSVESRHQAYQIARAFGRRWDRYSATLWIDDEAIWIEGA
jgi:hypothetical protein